MNLNDMYWGHVGFLGRMYSRITGKCSLCRAHKVTSVFGFVTGFGRNYCTFCVDKAWKDMHGVGK